MIRNTAALALIFFVFSSPLLAQDQRGLYLGGGLGAGIVGDEDDGPENAGVPEAENSNVDLSWKLFAGYQFNKYFGVEGFYTDLGNGSSTSLGGVQTTEATRNLEMDARAYGGSITAGAPIFKGVRLFGKVGVAGWDTDVESSLAGARALNDSGVSLMFGAGGQYDITKNVSVRAEWERFNISNTNVDSVTGNLIYRFD